MPRRPGTPNRNYPALTLDRALKLPRIIQEGASGLPTDRLTLSQLVDNSPSSSVFIQLVLSARAYGLTTGGKNADVFALTELGSGAVSEDALERRTAQRQAVMNIDPFRVFLTAYDKRKVPQPAALRAFLTGQAAVAPERVEECMAHLLKDARTAGLLRSVKGSEYVDLQATTFLSTQDEASLEEEEVTAGDTGAPPPLLLEGESHGERRDLSAKRPSAIFLGHGRNKKPLEQLTKILDEYKIPYKVAVDEPNRGRPISQKVADVMDQCGAAILIFTGDQEFRDADGNTTWRPSENVVYELGAAAVKYGSRIIIFKEDAVDFATNFRDIGHISFEKDKLDSKGMELFRELIDFELVKFSVPGE